MFAFLRTNLSKAVGNIFIFFLVTLVTFSSVVMMSSFNYSKVISNMKFRTEKIKSVFSDLTQNTDNLFNSLANNLDYDDNRALQWVTYQEFQENVNKTYYQATLADFLNNKNLYNYFLTPQQVKQYANDPNILAIIKSFNPNFATLFDLAFPIWQQYQEYPYLTFGFKLYEPSNTGLYSDLTGNWEMDNLKIARSFKFEGFFNNNFDHWMYFKNIYTTAALADLKTINNNFINIILPMQMAKVLNVKMGDILPASLESNQLIGSLSWNHLSLRVVGVNYYNYSDNMVLMDPSAFYHYFFSQYQQVFPSSKITINKLTSLANGSLSTKGMEVLKNLGFYSKNQKYEDYGSYNLIGNYLSYAMNNFPQQGSMMTTWEVLLNSMQLLNIFFYIIAIVILFVLVFLIFDENKHFIINLKILGYSNSKISSYFMLPYLLFFIVFLIINSFLSYFIIKALFLILFNYSATLFLITIPYVSLVLVSLGFLVILFLIYLFAYYYISRQPFMLILNE